jgi:NAD(P)H-hydrate epimerase
MHAPPEPTFAWCAANLVFTRDAIRAVDQQAIEQFGLPGVALMENAAAGLAHIACAMLEEKPGPVTILCGPGNNGGDGFALARHLHNQGVETRLGALAPVHRYEGDAEINLDVAQRMGLVIRSLHHLEQDELAETLRELVGDCALVVDAMLGTGLTSPPREPIASVIRWLNHQRAQSASWRTLAVDIPSGLDCDTGEPLGVAVHADRTATMAGMKTGLAKDEARSISGEVTVIDIGAPIETLLAHGTRRA